MRLLIAIAAWGLGVLVAGAANYYVATNGLDTNPGTEGSPFLTIQKGVNTAVGGDVVNVTVGSYNENVTSARGGSPGTRIIINGGGVATNYSFLFTHSNITVTGFALGRTNSWTIFMGAGGHFTVLSNNVFDVGYVNPNSASIIKWDNPVPSYNTNAPGHTSPWGVNLPSGCTIISNTFKRLINESGGIQMYGFTNTIIGNTFKDCDNVDYLHIYGGTNRVIGNLFTNGFTLNGTGHGDWFQVAGQQGYGARGILMESNTVIGLDGDHQLCMLEGQDCVDMEEITFRNNVFRGVSSKGTMGVRNVYWHNNTFIKCSTNPITAGPVLIFVSITNATYTNYTFSSGHGGRVYNNAFLYCGSSSTNNNAYRFWIGSPDGVTNGSADYNFIAKSNYALVAIDPDQKSVGEAGYDYQQWWEDHGINGGNPYFYNETNDFRIQAISPLIGTGTNLSSLFATDFRGTARGSTFDIGAYEYLDPLSYLSTNGVDCEVEPRALMGIIVSAPNVNTIAWPTNQYRNLVQLYRRTFTNDPTQWANWSSIHTNSSTAAGVFNDTNISTGIHYEYQLRTGSTNTMCGTNSDYGYYAFTYLNGGWKVPLKDQRGSVILLCEQGVTNSLASELTTLVSDLRGDGYRVFRHDIAAVEVPTNGVPGSWYTAVTNTKALIVADYSSAPSNNWTLFIVGHVPIPYSGANSPGSHVDNNGAHPADWYYADTNATAWTDSTVNDTTSDWPDAHNVPSDGKWDQNNPPSMPELRMGRIDLRNMPAFGKTEVQLLSQYLDRNHEWRHKQFTVRDLAMVGTNSTVTVAPYEVFGTYSQLFGNGTNYHRTNWLSAATNASASYLMASSHGNGNYTNDLLLGRTLDFAAAPGLYSVFNSMYGSYFGDWDSGVHTNDVMLAPLATPGYTLGLYYREQQVDMNPSSMSEPYADDLFHQAANWFVGSSAQYVQNGYWYTNGSTFLNPLRNAQYTEYFGDPTLRLRQVDPPSSLVITPTGSDNVLTWTASSDAVEGHHVYRAPTSDLNSFTRLTSSVDTDTTYTDAGTVGTAYTYMVRAVKLEQTDSRSFYHASQGAFAATEAAGITGTRAHRKVRGIRLRP